MGRILDSVRTLSKNFLVYTLSFLLFWSTYSGLRAVSSGSKTLIRKGMQYLEQHEEPKKEPQRAVPRTKEEISRTA